MNQMNSDYSITEKPSWLDKGSFNEVKFCWAFLERNPMIYVGGSFFTKEGRITDEDSIRKEIYEMLNPYIYHGLLRKTSNILEILKLEAYVQNLPVTKKASRGKRYFVYQWRVY